MNSIVKRDYELLIESLAAGRHVESGRIAQVLAAANIDRDQVRRAVEKLREKRYGIPPGQVHRAIF